MKILSLIYAIISLKVQLIKESPGIFSQESTVPVEKLTAESTINEG